MILPPAKERADLSLMRRLIGPAILGMLPGMLGMGGKLDILGMVGSGGIGALPTDGGNWPPAGDLTADTSADMDTGDTWETPKLGGGWLISAVEKFNFGKFEPVWKREFRKSWKTRLRTAMIKIWPANRIETKLAVVEQRSF